MRRPTIILVAFMSATALAVAQDRIKVIYDPRPDADFPLEARFVGTKPDSGSSDGKFGVSRKTLNKLTAQTGAAMMRYQFT